MQIDDSVALVTGANRGIGVEFVRQLQQRGARKVYAAMRTAETLTVPGIEVICLDITDRDQVARAAGQAGDVTLLINNAGIATRSALITGDLDQIRQEMDVHYWGTLNMVRAFAPILGAGGGGAILNMLSVLSWLQIPGATAYGAAKAAAWSLTDGARLELASQHTLVTGVFVGAVDTRMMDGYDIPKNDPAAVASAALDGIERGDTEVLVDDDAVQTKRSLARDPRERYAELAQV